MYQIYCVLKYECNSKNRWINTNYSRFSLIQTSDNSNLSIIRSNKSSLQNSLYIREIRKKKIIDIRVYDESMCKFEIVGIQYLATQSCGLCSNGWKCFGLRSTNPEISSATYAYEKSRMMMRMIHQNLWQRYKSKQQDSFNILKNFCLRNGRDEKSIQALFLFKKFLNSLSCCNLIWSNPVECSSFERLINSDY